MDKARSSVERSVGPPNKGTEAVNSTPESNAEDEVEMTDSNAAARTARYKLMSPAKLPNSRSPCQSIPPDLSPSSFLESPVLLSNVKVEPSPTTGSFCKPRMMHGYGGSTMFSIINTSAAMSGSKPNCFEFPSTSGSSSAGSFSLPRPSACAGTTNQQSDPGMQVQVQSLPHYVYSSVQIDSDEPDQELLSNIEVQAPNTDQSGIASTMNERVSEDGYSWHKYGQKLVKGCEYPRSYYKCAYPNCEVKKMFERAPDGQISEIIYKGSHDHPKPQPNNLLSNGYMTSIQENGSEKFDSLTGVEEKPSTISGQMTQNKDPTVTAELSHTIGIEDDVEAGPSQLNRIPDDAEDPFVKRRKMEIGGMDINSIFKPIREPRVVVQTLSEVDVLDDGYRWRKYGQKVVRGNPNPRLENCVGRMKLNKVIGYLLFTYALLSSSGLSQLNRILDDDAFVKRRSYYKCTSTGCSVRKHVERASHDFKAVLTTYEGKHKHDVPTAKNSIHDSAANLASRARPQQSETVSLRLGVGISSSANNNQPDQLQAVQIQPSSNLLLLDSTPASSFPGYLNGSLIMHGIRGNHEGFHVMNPSSSHSTRSYPQSIGKLVMGP